MYSHEWISDLRALPAADLFLAGVMLGMVLTLAIIVIGGHRK